MFEQLKTEGASASRGHHRIGIYVAGLLVLGGLIVGISQFSGKRGPEKLPGARPAPPSPEEVAAPVVDPERLPAVDDATIHTRYQADALDYLLGVVDRDLSSEARRLTSRELAELPFDQARGQVFEVEGTIVEIRPEVYETPKQRLWSLLIEGADGSRAIFLKHGFESDNREGRPEDALRTSTEYLKAGDAVVARGVYLQRRTGTLGDAIIRDPVPVLVATPPSMGFRKMPARAVGIGDPGEADWDEVKDRFLNETQTLDETAAFQIAEWARRIGHAKIVEDIRSGKLPARAWDKSLFDRWGQEVEIADASVPRPLTESLRGKFFKTPGLIGSFQREGWDTLYRKASAWGLHELYLLDLVSDYWGNKAIRSWSVFPLETYETVEGVKWEPVRVWGFFLKNHTYDARQPRYDGPDVLTMPMFVIVHMEHLQRKVVPFGTLIWVISGIIVALALVFYVVLARGHKRENARLHAYRRDLRRRARGRIPAESADTEAAEAGEAPDDSE